MQKLLINLHRGDPIQTFADYRTTPISEQPILPVRPPVTPPPDVAPIPIPEPPPRRESVAMRIFRAIVNLIRK